MTRGRFITIEGGDGAGKSTHIPYLQSIVERAGHKALLTREPGGTALGEQLRHILLDSVSLEISDDTELLLMFSARMQHLQEVVLPNLDNGIWVICDRFTDATYAYQGGGRGIDENRIAELESWVQRGLQPDLTLLLDLPVELGFQRVQDRGAPDDRFEKQQYDFKNAVRNIYLCRANTSNGRMKVIDASQSLDQVAADINEIMGQFFADTGVTEK